MSVALKNARKIVFRSHDPQKAEKRAGGAAGRQESGLPGEVVQGFFLNLSNSIGLEIELQIANRS
jgi:hypothetical protein